MRSILLLFALLIVVTGFNSCKKITEDQLINGLWQVNRILVDTSTNNFLNTLPHYPDGNDCCAYKLDFVKDNTLIAYYITYNNFNRISAGNWEATAYNEVYIKVDSFIDGTFKITQPTFKKRILTSEENHIRVFDGTSLDTAKTVIEMQKI